MGAIGKKHEEPVWKNFPEKAKRELLKNTLPKLLDSVLLSSFFKTNFMHGFQLRTKFFKGAVFCICIVIRYMCTKHSFLKKNILTDSLIDSIRLVFGLHILTIATLELIILNSGKKLVA